MINFFLKYNIDEIWLLTRQIYTKEILLSNSFQIPFMTVKGIFYPMIGYYLDKAAGTKKYRWQYALLIPFIALCINGGITYYDGIHSQFSQLYIEMFDYITAIGIFVLVKRLFLQQVNCKKHPLFCTIISQLGGLTLGMYFFDIVLGFMFYRKLEAYMGLSVAKYSLVWCIFDLSIGATFTYVYKKIWRRIIFKMKEKRLS